MNIHTASICLDKIPLTDKHPRARGEWIDVIIWSYPNPDQYKRDLTIQIQKPIGSQKKGAYIGNGVSARLKKKIEAEDELIIRKTHKGSQCHYASINLSAIPRDFWKSRRNGEWVDLKILQLSAPRLNKDLFITCEDRRNMQSIDAGFGVSQRLRQQINNQRKEIPE